MTTALLNSSNHQTPFQSLKFRPIGPPRGGRVLAVAGHPTEPATFYFGACAGGIWKTEDGGSYWENISDGFLKSAAVGALTVSEADPNVIYAGMGESTIRLDVSYGDGVYKSTNGGKSWKNMGLAETKHIAEIRVHPQNPDLVYVAAFGHAFGPNPERGVYRSKDGGETWELVLHRSEKAGAIDLTMDPNNPRILYASMWEAYRNFWTLSSGGPDSGIFKSVDGGDTWTEITDNPGLPTGIKGKIGVSVSPAQSDRVWAIIEADDTKSGMYRSDDGGDTWKQVSDNRDLIHRPWYYCHVFADPQDADTVYVTNLKMWKSVDGGQTYSEITTPHGDNHDLWIDPTNPKRMVEGNDGGACVSFNGGASWSTIYNQLTAQFYRIDVDNQFPYRVYGTQQDNSSISVPTATEKGAIPWSDCYPAGTGESGYIAVHPDDHNIVYVGAIGSSPGGGNALQRYDHRSKQIRLVTVWPDLNYGRGAIDLKYRFAWTYPILFSPHDSNTLYAAGNHICRTTDEGQSWEVISPDLSRNDADKLQPSGGPLTLDTSGAEVYATVFAFVESTHEAGVFWAGTDDGLLHISKDGGENWQDITPSDLPEWALNSTIEASLHDPATLYVAATRYKLDDYQPYLYKTNDYGQNWQRIDGEFPQDEITRVIREDPKQQGLLYVGTETGLYVSLNDGANWQRLQNNLPVVPIYDLKIKGDELVVGTHGRSFWILDDITPLRTLASTSDLSSSSAFLFPPKPTHRLCLGWSVDMFRGPGKNYTMSLGKPVAFKETVNPDGEQERQMLDSGENPPRGVVIHYILPEDVSESVSLAILDADGNEIRQFKPKAKETSGEKAGAKEQTIPTESGMNRFLWDMYYASTTKVEGDKATENLKTGPMAAPGTYQVQLTVGDTIYTESFEILADPRTGATQEDFDAQFQLWNQITHKLGETHEGVNRLRRIRGQVAETSKRVADLSGDSSAGITQAADALVDRLTAIENQLVQTGAKTGADRLRLPAGLNARLANLISVISSADAQPTQQTYDVYDGTVSKIDEQLALLNGLIGDDVAAFNDMVQEAAVPAVVI